MSLKDFTKEVFTQYGFTEEMISIYLAFLRIPRATVSQAYLFLHGTEEVDASVLEADLAKVLEITTDLVDKGFLQKVTGIVDRYIPLEPFFELFTKESEGFQKEISKIIIENYYCKFNFQIQN